jgi:hypothetical protein
VSKQKTALEQRAIPTGLGNGKAAAIRHGWTFLDQVRSAFGQTHPVAMAAEWAITLLYHHVEGELLREQRLAASQAESTHV